MSSQWVNKYAIMRDLSLVQGCVPVDVAGTVEAGDKPPLRNVNEDTEEDFYRHWVGGNGDFEPPDLGLIKHMLEVVKNHDVPSEEEVEIERLIQISKLNPLCQEFYPQGLASGDKNPKQDIQKQQSTQKPTSTQKQLSTHKPPSTLEQITNYITKSVPKTVKPKKKSRNVAVLSLLENINDDATENKNNANIKPPHSTNSVDTKAVEKVSGWLETQELQPSVHTKKSKNALQLDLDPTSMFKKKKSHNTIAPKPIKEPKSTSPYDCGKYVPSNKAAEYYKKFLECSRMKEMVQENVWTKVERQMKEIDERRVAEAELFALSLALCRDDRAPGILAADPIKQKLEMIFLPNHRHALPGPCRVCELHTRLTQDKQHAVTVGDSWRNKTGNETIGDAWRNEHKTFVDEHVKKIDDFCKNQSFTDTDHTDGDDTKSSYEERKNEPVAEFNIENGNVNKIDNWRNRDNAIMNKADDWRNETNTWRSDPKASRQDTSETKEPENVCTSSINTENAESWASLDDEDEIDAWKFEILDDDNDHYNAFYEASETIDETLQTAYGSSSRNENKHVETANNIETYEAISNKHANNFENTVNNNYIHGEIKAENKTCGTYKFKESDIFSFSKSSMQCKTNKELKTDEKDAKTSFDFEIAKSCSNTESVKYKTGNKSFHFEIKKPEEYNDSNKYSQLSEINLDNQCEKKNNKFNLKVDDDDDDETVHSHLEMLDDLSDSDFNCSL